MSTKPNLDRGGYGLPPEQYALMVLYAVALLLSVTVIVTVYQKPTWQPKLMTDSFAKSV